MPSISETAYPRLKGSLTELELSEIYTPTLSEMTFAKRATKSREAQVGFLIALKTFQRLGYSVLIDDIPIAIIQHIVSCCQLNVTSTELEKYYSSSTRRRHVATIRDHLGIQAWGPPAKQVMTKALEMAAASKHDLADMINVAIEELIHQRFELPGFSSLVKAARRARHTITASYHQKVFQGLQTKDRIQLDRMFRVDPKSGKTQWNDLKAEPGRPMLSELKLLIERLQWLSQYKLSSNPLADIPAIKVKHFAEEAQSLDANQMRELRPDKRCCLAASLITKKYSQTLDDLADIFIKRMQKMHHKAKEALSDYRKAIQDKVDTLVLTLRDMTVAFIGEDEKDAQKRLDAINQVVGDQGQEIVDECDAYLAYTGGNYFPFLLQFYRGHRATLFRFLDTVPLHSSTQDQTLEAAIRFVKAHRNSRKPLLSNLDPQTDKPLNLKWIPKKWWSLVTNQQERSPTPETLDRRNFELCVFSHILLELKSGDLYIEGSLEYGDYFQQLISWDEYHASIKEYGDLLKFPVESKPFVSHLRQWLESTAQKTDQGFPDNTGVSYKNDRVVIHRNKKKQYPPTLEELKQLIAERITPVSLLDVLTDTELWLNWTRHFGPISGFEGKINDPVARYLATTFCFGCSLGPSQLSQALGDFDRKQLSHVHHRHISEEKLQRAIVSIINAYNRFSLPQIWGSGNRAAVDGTKWNIYENNLLAEYHIRYGGYGGIGYYHVSENYIALFSNFIPCGVWEGVYIFDGLRQNQSEIQPDTIHGDTQAQSATVYGLAHLLGIKLMPRIRHWQDLEFLRPRASSKYKYIDELFTGVVDAKLIETHLPDMLRVALSIMKGKINASTILRKLGTNSRKNKLYQAFHALGCLVRTEFLLHYIHDADLRSIIQSATNKVESFHAFVQWLSFGGAGVIATNNREEQQKFIKYNHLIANCVIFYNVFEMSRILNELLQEGYNIDPKAVAGLSPYGRWYLNRFGKYDLDVNRQPPKLQFDVPVFSAIPQNIGFQA